MERAGELIESIVDDARALGALDLSSVAPQELGELLRRVERARAAVDAAANSVLDRFDAEGAAGYDGLRSTSSWLTQRCQMTGATAARRVRTARNLRHLPEVARGYRSGRFSADQADLFARARNSRTAEAMAEDESTLAALADRLRPDDFGRELRGWAEVVDTDGAEPERGHRERSFSFVQTLDDTWTGRLDLASADGAFLHAAVEAMAEALYRDQEAGSAVRGDADGRADDDAVRRSPGQRRADALLELVRRGIDPASLLDPGVPADAADRSTPTGSRIDSRIDGDREGVSGRGLRPGRRRGRLQVALHLLLDAGDLEAGRGADTFGGRHLSPAATDRLLCDGAMTAVLRDRSNGSVLDMGRRRRVVSPAQWAALAIRDRGCSFPGCAAPPQDCDAHHVVHWRHGGPTDLDNLALTCHHHHSLVHEGGWGLAMTSRGPTWSRPDGSDVGARPGWSTGPPDAALTPRPHAPPPDAPSGAVAGTRPGGRRRAPDPEAEDAELVRRARERALALRWAA